MRMMGSVVEYFGLRATPRFGNMTPMSEPSNLVDTCLRQGVQFPHPDSVYIDPAVNSERIAPGVVIHPGCRILGRETSIGPGCILGAEAPVTLDSCQLGTGICLQGGAFASSTFLNRSSMGSGAHIRAGTLVEEEAGGAHTVGLKQTILLPHVVLGSLINFCDCLMAGGISRKDHSEVGSSYVHFNYTPHRDKAAASLFGDVPHGVMMDQPAIFLGGQGGAVGPVRVTFGVTVPAGSILRKDVLQPGLIFPAPPASAATVPFQPGAYRSIQRILTNNLNYLGNLAALCAWYREVRALFMQADPFQHACWVGALAGLKTVFQERIHRLNELASNMPRSLDYARSAEPETRLGQPPYDLQQRFMDRWPEMKANLLSADHLTGSLRERDAFLATVSGIPAHTDYLAAMKALEPGEKAIGTRWLQSIVEQVADFGF